MSGAVTNTNQRSANLGSQAYSQWQANLVSGAQCPAPVDTGVIGVQIDSRFYLADKSAYDK
jgi:hypothetical protein